MNMGMKPSDAIKVGMFLIDCASVIFSGKIPTCNELFQYQEIILLVGNHAAILYIKNSMLIPYQSSIVTTPKKKL
jgi:hypothetical protein